MAIISVIVPVYNAENTLRQCVDSILSQDFKNFELLLIDDGSYDSSPAICDEYAGKDSRVKAYHKPNGGVSSSRNVGLDNTRGEWITFIDSDDYITDGYLDDVDGCEEDILIKGYKSSSTNGDVGSISAEELAHFSGMRCFLNHYIADTILRGPVFKFYKRSIVGDLRFLTDMKIGEDAYFVFRYLAKCKCFAVLPNGEYMVRVAEKPDEVKYAITVDYAVQSLNHLKDAYEGLVQSHGIDKSHFLSYIGYFKRISKSDWGNDKAKWYNNKEILALYDYVWTAISFKQKLHMLTARVLRT